MLLLVMLPIRNIVDTILPLSNCDLVRLRCLLVLLSWSTTPPSDGGHGGDTLLTPCCDFVRLSLTCAVVLVHDAPRDSCHGGDTLLTHILP